MVGLEKQILFVTIVIGIISVFSIALITGGITGHVTLNMAELHVTPYYDMFFGDVILDVSAPVDNGNTFNITVNVNAPTEKFYVYKTAYYSKGNQAIPFQLTSTGPQGVEWIQGSATAELELSKSEFPYGGYIYAYTCREYTHAEINAIVTDPHHRGLINSHFNGRDKAQLCGFREFTNKIEQHNWRLKAFATPESPAPAEATPGDETVDDPAIPDDEDIQLTLNGPAQVAVNEIATFTGNAKGASSCTLLGVAISDCNSFTRDFKFSGAGTYPITLAANGQAETVILVVGDIELSPGIVSKPCTANDLCFTVPIHDLIGDVYTTGGTSFNEFTSAQQYYSNTDFEAEKAYALRFEVTEHSNAAFSLMTIESTTTAGARYGTLSTIPGDFRTKDQGALAYHGWGIGGGLTWTTGTLYSENFVNAEPGIINSPHLDPGIYYINIRYSNEESRYRTTFQMSTVDMCTGQTSRARWDQTACTDLCIAGEFYDGTQCVTGCTTNTHWDGTSCVAGRWSTT